MHNEETTTKLISCGDGKTICWADDNSWGRLCLYFSSFVSVLPLRRAGQLYSWPRHSLDEKWLLDWGDMAWTKLQRQRHLENTLKEWLDTFQTFDRNDMTRHGQQKGKYKFKTKTMIKRLVTFEVLLKSSLG